MLAKTASCVAAKELVEEISKCPHMTALRMEGNTVGVEAAEAIAKALEKHPEFEVSLTRSWVCCYCYCSADILEGETEVYFCQTLKNSHYTIHCFTFIVLNSKFHQFMFVSFNPLGPRPAAALLL